MATAASQSRASLHSTCVREGEALHRRETALDRLADGDARLTQGEGESKQPRQVKSRGRLSSQIKPRGSVHLLGVGTVVQMMLKTGKLERWLGQLFAQLRELSQFEL